MKLGLGLGIGRRRRNVSIGPNFTVAPTISGTAEIGETLTRTTGTAVGTGVVTYVTEWQRDGVAIAAETGATYVLAAADDQKTVRVKITATDDTGDRVAYSSGASVTYAAPVAADGIAAQLWEIGVAISALNVATDFTGSNLTYALAPASDALPAGLSLSGAGSITGTPTDETLNLSIVVRGTNSGGSDDSTFTVTSTVFPVSSAFAVSTGPDEISSTASEGGTFYWRVDLTAAGAPSAAQIIAGGGDLSGSFLVEAGANVDGVDFSTLANGDYTLRAVLVDNSSATGNVVSDTFSIASEPAAFVDANWSVATGSAEKELDITIASLPDSGNSAITDLEYDVDAGGTWTSLAGTVGPFTITMAAASTSYAIRLRAVNAVGAGAAGNSESAESGAVAGGGITLVSVANGFMPDATTADYTMPATLLENDIVVLVAASDDNMTGTGINTADWVVDVDGRTASMSYFTAYKRMGATPDTVVNITSETPSGKRIAYAMAAFRGVNATTALDAATTTELAANLYDPPSITTVTNGAMVVPIIALDDDDSAAVAVQPSGYALAIAADTEQASTVNGATVGIAYKLKATAGAEDPGAWTGMDDANRNFTMALRPA